MATYKQRTTCEGCTALKDTSCKLSFYIDKNKKVPLEPCPKPLYADDLYACEMMGYNKWERNCPNYTKDKTPTTLKEYEEIECEECTYYEDDFTTCKQRLKFEGDE